MSFKIDGHTIENIIYSTSNCSAWTYPKSGGYVIDRTAGPFAPRDSAFTDTLKPVNDLYLLVKESPGTYNQFKIRNLHERSMEILIKNEIVFIQDPVYYFNKKSTDIIFVNSDIIKKAKKKGIKIIDYFPSNLLTEDEEIIKGIIE